MQAALQGAERDNPRAGCLMVQGALIKARGQFPEALSYKS